MTPGGSIPIDFILHDAFSVCVAWCPCSKDSPILLAQDTKCPPLEQANKYKTMWGLDYQEAKQNGIEEEESPEDSNSDYSGGKIYSCDINSK